MIRVNLLASSPATAAQPRAWIPAEQRSSLAGLGMLLATGLAIGGWWYYLDQQRAATEQGITTAETRIEQLKEAVKVLEAVRLQKAELQERIALIDRLRAAKSAPVRMLNLVNSAVPDGLWLMEIKQSGAIVQIEGRAMSPSSVTDFAQALQTAGFFKMPVEIVSTVLETVEETGVYRFLLKAEPIGATVPATSKAVASTATPPPPAGRPGV
jgi:type IV pilus assembly protein PilN